MKSPALQYKCTFTVPAGQAMFWQWVYASLLYSISSCFSVVGLFARYSKHLLQIYQWPGTWLFWVWVCPGGCRLPFATHLMQGKGREGKGSSLVFTRKWSISFSLICTGLQINSTYQLSPECCYLSLNSPSSCLVWKPWQSMFWPVLLSFFVLSWCSLKKKPKMVSVQVYVAHTLFSPK